MNRRALAWVVLCVLAVAGAAYSFWTFPRAFPLVSVDVRMDREAALDEARRVAESRGWGPSAARQAASFGVDEEVQSFVELEAGGNEAFARVLDEGLYQPYTWTVRRFREYETNETRIVFTPEGRLYGFEETLAEDAPGAQLDADEAQRRAEAFASSGWEIDLAAFTLVEASQELRPGGRLDHTLVYERTRERLGEGRYRLRLVVRGDRVTELTRFVLIPEAFERRFQSMRSLNNTIALGAGGFFAVVYLLGGCGVGLFFLLRRRALLWRKPLAWGALIGGLLFLMQVANWPLHWMGYDTAVSAAGFSLDQLMSALQMGLGMGALAMLSAVAGEGLGRLAFPHHVQLWRSWSRDVASSRPILRQTIVPFLLLGPMFAYMVSLYAFAKEHLGWWNPSYALSDPNMLASYLPWLSALAISLQAGFFEECVFRAVPLAAAALLGQRFGAKRLWIGGTLVLQALVFGAVHANYPAQPAYARIVEIGIPFMLVGIAYLMYGLLPAIVLHFAVDVVFFAMPLFAVSAAGIWIDRTIVVLLTLTPVWIVLVARLRAGRWTELADEHRNGAWTPPAPPAAAVASAETAGLGLSSRARVGVAVTGLVGLLAWGAASRFQADVPSLDVGREAAIKAARAALAERGFVAEPPWRELVLEGGDAGQADRFVWNQGGPGVFRDVVGTYLEAPHWIVRYARFEGDLAERAEEYWVRVDRTGRIARVQHVLPEARPGVSLDEEVARDLAYGAAAGSFQLSRSDLREISAEPAQRPARRDWTFVFADPDRVVGEGGEARMRIEIAGDEVTDAFRFVHVPETWQRAERDRSARMSIVSGVAQMGFVVILLAGSVVGIVRWSRGRFARRSALLMLLTLGAVAAVASVNRWPVIEANLRTDRPYGLQLGQMVVFLAVSSLVVAAVMALGVGLTHRAVRLPRASRLMPGLGLGAAAAGVLALLGMLTPSPMPEWPSFAPVATSVPIVGVGVAPITQLVVLVVVLLFVLTLIDATTRCWSARRGVGALIALVAGLILAGRGDVLDVGWWALAGVGTGVLLLVAYVTVLRRDLGLLPWMVTALVTLELVRVGAMRLFPGIVPGTILACALVAGLAWAWTRRLEADAPPADATTGALAPPPPDASPPAE